MGISYIGTQSVPLENPGVMRQERSQMLNLLVQDPSHSIPWEGN